MTTTSNLVIGSKYKHNLRTSLSVDKLSSKYNELVELLLSPDLELVGIICQLTLVKEANQNINISEVLVVFFEIHCNLKSTFLLKWAIDKEIESTNNGPTLFRGLSTATRLISAFYKRVGDEYLKYLLQPFILDIVSRNFSFEIDPEKAGKGMNIQNNLEKLITITQHVLDKILDSLDQCPTSIRNILHHTQERVEKKFPFMKTTVIGGFIFLRFICPAIVAPEIFGLTNESPSTDSRRGLVLVSKLLQNLANEMPFGVGIKEEYMQYLNDFITNNSERIHVFFDKLAYRQFNDHPSSPPVLSKDSSKKNLHSTSPTNQTSPISNHTNSNITNDNYNQQHQEPKQKNYTDEFIFGNINTLVNSIIENREKIETHLTNENSFASLELLKKLESALLSLKQKGVSKLIPWKRNKESLGSSSSSATKAHVKKSTTSPITSSIISSISSNGHNHHHHHNNNNNHNHNNYHQKSFGDLHEDEVQTSLLNSIQDYQNYYRNKLDLKDIELKSAIDEVNFLKKESEDYKYRTSVIKKLRDELDSEKMKRKDAESQLLKCIERLKLLGDAGSEIIQDLNITDHESSISNATYSELIEDNISTTTSTTNNTETPSTNSTLKKGKSNITSLKKSAQQQLRELQYPSQSSSSSSSHDNNNMKRSVTNGAISDSSKDSSHNLSISSSNLESSNSNHTHMNNNKENDHSSKKAHHSRTDSNSEYLNSDLTSESNPTYDESEDRIIQAYVDGELEEDDQGMDLLEFLKEVGENHQAKKLSESHSISISNDGGGITASSDSYDSISQKKKRSSMALFKLPKFSKKNKDKFSSSSSLPYSNSNNNISSTTNFSNNVTNTNGDI